MQVRHFVRRHKRKIVFTHSVIIMTLLASSAITFNAGETALFLQPRDKTELGIGDTADVDVMLSTTVPVNAIGVTLGFPPDLLEIVGISKERSFLDLWTEETEIREDAGEIHFSGGTLQKGGLTGTSTALTITVKARRSGAAQLYFKEAKVLASDGRGTAVESVDRPFTYTIRSAELASGSSPSPSAPALPRADINGDGRIDIADMSMLLLKLVRPYDARYDLNGDGVVNIGDLSVLFSYMGKLR
jgi:hypothetical protein